MVAYTKEEMIGITDLQKSLGGVVNKLKSHTLEKIAIMKNNMPEAVVIPIDKYERLEEMERLIEQIAMSESISKRVQDGKFEGGFDLESYHKKRMKR